MLQLQSYKYRNTYQSSYYSNGSEHLTCGETNARLQNHSYYFRGPSSIMHADLPLHMNGINLKRYYFLYDETSESQDIMATNISERLLNIFNSTPDDTCMFITGYLADETLLNKEHDYEFIDEDLWTEFKGDSIEALFNKCVDQTSLRETERQARSIHQHIRVFKSKAKHIILMLTDYCDNDQESETFLALGLVPIIFTDWKDKFCKEEMDYFKCFVNRSQVKRISNVKINECFKTVEALESYHTFERDIRYKTLFQKIANARVRTVERRLNEYEDKRDQAIRTYDEALKKITEFEIIINKYKEGTSEIVTELQDVSKAKGVYDMINWNDTLLQIVLRVPLDYFDTDEAECAIKNLQDDVVKRFITEVFIEQKYKLFIRTDMYYAYTSDQNFQDFTNISEDSCKTINALFNPHFQFYHCLGDYRPSLIKAMRDQDLTMFVNIGIAAARSMNFKDGAVCGRWFQWLHNALSTNNDYYLSYKCLEKDGHLYSLGQWLHNDLDEEVPQVNVIEAEEI